LPFIVADLYLAVLWTSRRNDKAFKKLSATPSYCNKNFLPMSAILLKLCLACFKSFESISFCTFAIDNNGNKVFTEIDDEI